MSNLDAETVLVCAFVGYCNGIVRWLDDPNRTVGGLLVKPLAWFFIGGSIGFGARVFVRVIDEIEIRDSDLSLPMKLLS